MKQMETKKVCIGGNTFVIKPFPAFKAANLTGELAVLIAPLIGGIGAAGNTGGLNANELMDMDIEKITPAITQAFSGLNGDKVESLLKKLLTDSSNVIFIPDDSRIDSETLTEDIVNEVFCGEVQDIFLLAFEVIKLNYKGFFKKAGALFGRTGGQKEAGTET